MNPDAKAHLDKAREFLARARKLDPVEFDKQVIHPAYYAMYHAAVAALYQAHGDSSLKHGRVIQHFGELAGRTLGELGLSAGSTLADTYALRRISDYDVDIKSLSDEASRSVTEAESILGICEGLIGTSISP